MQQCPAKIKEQRQVYQKARQANCCSSVAPKTCYFNKELHAILSSDSTSTTKSTADTSWGLEAAASGVNPKDDVVDEEVELEEDVEHMTGSSGGAVSQDLFLTPEGSSQSQHYGYGVMNPGKKFASQQTIIVKKRPNFLVKICPKCK
ncbi:hypothetical protein UY3_06039 [Chelonia mydas]|uniref:Uncharacterized protein n=1 Tax=Chelonia mydas TaxID=8469 RepID=M7BFR6_CHEMY|nr:hypothetical protein UY3_06039 [Chelonia mydas]